MKTSWKSVYLMIPMVIFGTLPALSQCNGISQSMSFDTVMIGTGNSSHLITLSQFDPSIGTLYATNINSTISVNYGFSLGNILDTPVNFSVTVGRYDSFYSSALSAPHANLVNTRLGSYLLNPGDTITEAPSDILYRYQINDSIISDIAPFLGTNTIQFKYRPITYTNLTGSELYYYSASASDTVHFTITYYYCSNTVLANQIGSFSAQKEGSQVRLIWNSPASQSGMNFEVEEGTGSNLLNPVALVAAETDDSVYSYNYFLSPNDQGMLYFRLKIISSTGQVSYSEIRIVDVSITSVNGQFAVYPNPNAGHLNISFPDQGDWSIGIYAVTGNLIEFSKAFHCTQTVVDLPAGLSSGVYFIRACNIETGEKINQSILYKH